MLFSFYLSIHLMNPHHRQTKVFSLYLFAALAMPLIIYRGEIKTKLACVGALLCAMSARRWSSACGRNEKKKKENQLLCLLDNGIWYWKLRKLFVYWLSASGTQHTNTTHFLTISSLHLLGYCVRRPAAVDSKEFACCLVPWREEIITIPFTKLRMTLIGWFTRSRASQEKSLENSLELNFFFFLFLFKRFSFLP